MRYLVRVRVRRDALAAFAAKLQSNQLDRSSILGETSCLRDDPEVGYTLWETKDRAEFDRKFDPWREFYSAVEVQEVITPLEAMSAMMRSPAR